MIKAALIWVARRAECEPSAKAAFRDQAGGAADRRHGYAPGQRARSAVRRGRGRADRWSVKPPDQAGLTLR